MRHFIKEFEDFHPNIALIDYDKENILAVDLDTNKAYFAYYVNDDISFCFHLLCECRDWNAEIFKSMIKKSNYELQTKETETDYYNTLIIKK